METEALIECVIRVFTHDSVVCPVESEKYVKSKSRCRGTPLKNISMKQ
ncbi:MAG: hypothetical protein QW369_03640 [Desulfurococcaceae archaeon]